MSREPDDEYKVGKNCPPLETHFKKGQSGNATGRPKNKETPEIADDLNKRLREKRTVMIGGVPKKMTRAAIINEAMINKAARGDTHTYRVLMSHAGKAAGTDVALLKRQWIEQRHAENLKSADVVRAKLDLMHIRMNESKDIDIIDPSTEEN